jgi:ankyrin repeat protein
VLCVIIQHQDGSNAVEDVDKSADTPLHHACFEGHYDIAEELIKHGANVDARYSLIKAEMRNFLKPMNTKSGPGFMSDQAYRRHS